MADLQLANVLQFFVVAAFWIFVLCKMIPELRLDSFCQNMFIVRDELFDYAADGNISFDHPAYILLRKQMNGFIRYGHHLTVFRGFLTFCIHKVSSSSDRSDWHSEWQTALQSIEDASVCRKLEQFYDREMKLVAIHLLAGSPLLWVVICGFAVQLWFQGATDSAKQLVRAAAKKAFTGPINNRLIEEAAQGEFA